MAKRVKESRKEAAVVSKQANEVAKKSDLVAKQEAQVRACSGCARADQASLPLLATCVCGHLFDRQLLVSPYCTCPGSLSD